MSADKYKERNHGFGDSPEVEGSPKVLNKVKQDCPECGCKELYMIEVELKDDPNHHRLILLKGTGTPMGIYVGCPACPYASPMMTTRR